MNEIQKKKKLITFPYPYMNGVLHLGHAYTLLCADIQARYYKMKGYDVLFPFGFHGSGMPIVACAIKLQRELEKYKNCDLDTIPKETQIKILLEMKVPPFELEKFSDPGYWIQYFSSRATEDLKKFNVFVDFNRSFYTTKLNPYYDSFITWQFTHLMNDGYVNRGTRYVIYSITDQQPCADHDRRKGEGVKPICFSTKCVQTQFGYLIVILLESSNSNIFINKNDEYVKFYIKSTPFICNKYGYLSISHQTKDCSPPEPFNEIICQNDIVGPYVIDYCDLNLDFGTGFYVVNNKEDINRKNIAHTMLSTDMLYYEPDGYVESRTGDRCIVALTDQWFINYGDQNLKDSVCQYVDTDMQFDNPYLYNAMQNSAKELNEWPCSRNFGLGTFIPGTTDLIDSLSDSTIYMAYYTIAHLIKDIPFESCHINNEMWEYVFLGKEYEFPKEYYDIIIKMREEFLYWYPVDIRVSGKDLIPNHLTMALYNHYAIWKNEDYMPKKYITNGYLMLNGKKMSKSEGNFLTMRDGIDKYGTNAVRYALAYNYSFDDGNFDEKFAKTISNKFGEKDWIKSNFSNLLNNTQIYDELTLWDNVINEDIDNIISQLDNWFEKTNFKSIIDAFDFLINSKNNYMKMQKIYHQPTIQKYILCVLSLLSPIVPDLVEEIVREIKYDITAHDDLSEWFLALTGNFSLDFQKWYSGEINFQEANTQQSQKYSYYRDIIFDVVEQCKKTSKKFDRTKSKCKIYVYKNFTDEEKQIISNPEIIDKQSGALFGKYKAFYKFIEELKRKYGDEVLIYQKNTEDEFNIVSKYINILYEYPCEVLLIEPSDESKFRFGPGKLKVICEKI
jgi:leucyl-tRNA synthetase